MALTYLTTTKFVHSPRAVEYAQRYSVEPVLSYLAYKVGILPDGFKVHSLAELVQATDLEQLKDYRIPIVCCPEEKLEKLCG